MNNFQHFSSSFSRTFFAVFVGFLIWSLFFFNIYLGLIVVAIYLIVSFILFARKKRREEKILLESKNREQTNG